jgi:hypothetical protein
LGASQRTMLLVAVPLIVLALFAVPALAGKHRVPPTLLQANLTGANQVPAGTGDPDGIGSAKVTVFTNKVCWNVRARRIQLPATEAHIHQGARGTNGNVVVQFAPPNADGVTIDCRPVSRALARQIKKNPAGFYVNIHNAEFPEGAIRGQLRRQ